MNTVKNFSESKRALSELEDRIIEKISADYRLKEINKPFVVLELDKSRVVLGSTKEIVGKVDYNYGFKRILEEVIGTLIGNSFVKIELKIAEAEFQALKKRIHNNIAAQKKEAAVLEDIDAQLKEGRCNLIPFPFKENKVRSELTIERHAIFAANTFKGDLRTYERKIKNPLSGEEFILRIEIGDRTGKIKGMGVLKQKHQEAFYKLAQIWSDSEYKLEQEERPFIYGYLELSVYDLVQKLRGDDAGNNYQKVLQLLNEMSSIRINIKKLDTKNGSCDIQDFSILSYDWRAKNFNQKTLRPNSNGESKVRIRFSDFITDNFLRKNVKSLMLNPYFSLKDQGRKGVAQLLYTMLDYELASKEMFHISLINLCSRIGLAQYKYKSDRKRKLESLVTLLNGKPILDGKYEIISYLEEAEDRRDWVFTARRKAIS